MGVRVDRTVVERIEGLRKAEIRRPDLTWEVHCPYIVMIKMLPGLGGSIGSVVAFEQL